jgi:hypothetical protein
MGCIPWQEKQREFPSIKAGLCPFEEFASPDANVATRYGIWGCLAPQDIVALVKWTKSRKGDRHLVQQVWKQNDSSGHFFVWQNFMW